MVGAVYNVTKFNEVVKALSPHGEGEEFSFDHYPFMGLNEDSEKRILGEKLKAKDENGLQLFEFPDPKSTQVKNSKLIHHQMKFRGVNRTTVAFALPFLFQILGLIILYGRENRWIYKLQSLEPEVILLDSFTYLSWAACLEVQYISMLRMVKEGLLSEDQFSHYGIQNVTAHLHELLSYKGMTNKMNFNFLRIRRALSISNFHEFYDVDLLEKSDIEIETYIKGRDPEFKRERMSTYDSIRYSESFLNSLILKRDLLMNETMSVDGSSTGLSVAEVIVRKNILNPILDFLDKGNNKLK